MEDDINKMSSVEFGQKLLGEQRKRADDERRRAEKFSRRTQIANLFVTGATTLLNNRLKNFNQNKLAEKNHLNYLQKSSKSVLDSYNTFLESGKSIDQYMIDTLLPSYRAEAETIFTERGATGLLPTKNISNAYILDNTTIREDAKAKGQEFLKLVELARNMPTDTATLEKKYNQYAETKMPTNIAGFLFSGVRNAFKGEDANTLGSKVNAHSAKLIDDPTFANFKTFQTQLTIYNDGVKGGGADFIEQVKKDQDKFDKVIKDTKVNYIQSTEEKFDVETNTTKTITVAIPVSTTTYTDGTTTSTKGDQEDYIDLTTKEGQLVVFNNTALNSIDDILNQNGMEEFNKLFNKDRSQNPYTVMGQVISMGQEGRGDKQNLYMESDIDFNAVLEEVVEASMTEFREILRVPDITDFQDANGNFESPEQEKAYNEALRTYNTQLENYMKELMDSIGASSRQYLDLPI